ncbi:MAG: hypothetical protein KDD45_14305, partial [Bdellovibrionales bacterium]|nr:hypothetical protein [Bdellovibrionales bacterium]
MMTQPKMAHFVTSVYIFITLVIFTLAPPGLAETNRKSWVETTYKQLPFLLKAAQSSNLISDPEVIDYLKAIEGFYNENQQPPLIFVDDSDQFIIDPNQPPRLMRAPEGEDEPIFINQKLLNEDGLSINLIQLIKLLTHELGHKTKYQNQDARDRWSQAIENFFSGYYFQSQKDDNSWVEVLSLSKEASQRELTTKPYLIQPTFLAFLHRPSQTINLTSELINQISEKSLLIRNLSADLNLAIAEVANAFKNVLKQQVAPFFDSLLNELSKSLGDSSEKNFSKNLDNLDGKYQYLSILEIQKVSVFKNSIIFDGHLNFLNSHASSVGIKLNGLPFTQKQSQPIQITVATNGIGASPALDIQLLASLEMDYENTAKVKSIRRSNNNVTALKVEVAWPSQPYGIDLVIQSKNGSFRKKGVHATLVAPNTYSIEFDLSNLPQFSMYTYSLLINDQKLIPLEREVEINNLPDNHTKLSLLIQAIPESFGIWGYQKTTPAFRTTFSHLNPPILFQQAISNENILIIPPSGFWLEFEIENDVEIVAGELFASVEQYILDIREKDKDDGS